MEFFGNSTNVTTTVSKGNLQEFKAKEECKRYLGEYASPKTLQDCIDNKLKGVAANTKSYVELTAAQQKAIDGVSAGSREDWSAAWKAMQIDQMKKNVPLEDVTNPTPLLIDKISSLPADSARRRSAENIKNTLDGTAPNVGTGMDNLTRESYKEVKRLVRQSKMLSLSVSESIPSQSGNQLLGINFSPKNILGSVLGNLVPNVNQLFGTEEGTHVSNLQDWRPYFANAVRPISDAIGSHADTDHAILKNSGGPSSLIPSSIASTLDKISSSIADELEGVFKSAQVELMQHLPSKIAGSIRQLSTALDSILSVPFEIMSDVYNGLMELMNEISNLIDNALSFVINWAFSIIGGLVDSIFPLDQLESILEPILEFAGELGDLLDLFGGFPALAKISSVLSVISGGFSSILTNLPYLYSLFKAKTSTTTITRKYDCITEIFELSTTKLPKIPRGLKILSAIGGVIGANGSLGAGIGNLGSMLSGAISSTIGSFTANIRDFSGLLAQILPNAIGGVLHWLLHKLCKMGMVGDLGFSIGSTFDFIRDSAFSKAMSKYATHHCIIAPLFGKEAIPKGSYINESSLGRFEDLKYGRGAQGNKGVAMIGPGGSITYKPFGSSQGYFFIGGFSSTQNGGFPLLSL